jgi:hypothetical protein
MIKFFTRLYPQIPEEGKQGKRKGRELREWDSGGGSEKGVEGSERKGGGDDRRGVRSVADSGECWGTSHCPENRLNHPRYMRGLAS